MRANNIVLLASMAWAMAHLDDCCPEETIIYREKTQDWKEIV